MICEKQTRNLMTYCQNYDKETIEQAEIKIKYESYFEKEMDIVEKMRKMEDKEINPEFNYHSLGFACQKRRAKS